nr:DNA-directed RNA polymerase II subunit RPB2 [Tanacetum cinerariifolium]
MIQPEPEGSTQGYPLVSVEVLRKIHTLAGNPVKEILLKLNLPNHSTFKDGGEAPVPVVDKADEMILQDTLQVSLDEHKSRQEQEARENVALVDEYLAYVEIEKMVKGKENVINDSSIPRNDEHNILGTRLEPRSKKVSLEVEVTNVVIPVNVYDDEEEENKTTDEVYELKRKEKGKILEESRNTPFPTPIRSFRIHTDLLQGRYEYLFEHLRARFMPRKSFAILSNHLHDAMAESLPTMVDKHVKEQVPEQVRNQVPVCVAEGLILERLKNKEEMEKMIDKAILQEPQPQTTSMPEQQYQLYLSMKDEPPLQQQDIAICRRHRSIKHMCLESHHLDRTMKRIKVQQHQRDPEAPALSLINQDLLYLKKGSPGPEKIVLSLHKFPAVIFNDDDIEERTSRWERVHDIQLGIKSYQQKVNLTAPTISFLRIEKHEMFSIIYEHVHGIIYKNRKKEKRVMRHLEIHKFCDATLNRVLEGLNSYNNDVKYGYIHKDLTKDEKSDGARAGHKTIYKISFGQIYLSKPMMTKSDGETTTLFLKATTLRNLTYSAPLYVDVTKRAIKKGHDCEEVTETQDFGKVFIRKVPIMLWSSYCTLFQNLKKDLMELGECPYDQGGYFIINESEKVLIAQAKMGNNHVYVFKKRQPNKYAYVGKVRSMTESKNRPPSMMVVRKLARNSAKGIHATLPYIRTEIPIIIVFRACYNKDSIVQSLALIGLPFRKSKKKSAQIRNASGQKSSFDHVLGISDQLTKELRAKAHSSVRITVDASRDRKCNVWSGGSLLAFLLSFQKTWSATVDFVLGRIEARLMSMKKYVTAEKNVGKIDRTFNHSMDPSIRRKLIVPAHPSSNKSVSFGFGFDPISDDYKIVAMSNFSCQSSFIYSLKTNSWSKIVSHTLNAHYAVSSCFLNGTLYWVVGCDLNDINRNRIMTFDLSTNVFGFISLPKPSLRFDYLMIIKDCLAVMFISCDDENHCSIWVMREYNNVASWTKAYDILEGKLMNEDHKDSISYNHETQTRSRLLVDSSYKVDVDMCIESLELIDKERKFTKWSKPFIFDIDGRTLEYGREDFCFITGFRFGKVNLDPDEEDHSEFCMRVFPKIENLKGEHLLELVNKDVKFAKFDDEDVVHDFYKWDAFPCGEYTWSFFHKRDYNFTVTRQKFHLEKLASNPKYEANYVLYGFVFPLKTFSNSIHWWRKDEDVIPRVLRSAIKGSSKGKSFHTHVPTEVLHEVHVRTGCLWYILKKRYMFRSLEKKDIQKRDELLKTVNEQKQMIIDLQVCLNSVEEKLKPGSSDVDHLDKTGNLSKNASDCGLDQQSMGGFVLDEDSFFLLDEDEDFIDALNPDTTKKGIAAVGDANMKNLKHGDILQLERKGYFRCDVPFIRPSKPNFHFSL